MIFDFNEHKHRFAVWTAARSVQRSFTNNKNIKEAINFTSIKSFSESNEIISSDQFDELQKEWCKAIIKSLEEKNISCSYGRASKIIAIYLKTSVILLNHGQGNKSQVIHPPIDRILLTNLSNNYHDLKSFNQKGWTNFEENDYWNLIENLKKKFGSFDWRLEEYWN